MGVLSKGITLAYGAIPTVLADLQEIPDIGASIEKVEITTLDDGNRRYIKGIDDYGDLEFVFLYKNESATDSFPTLEGIAATDDEELWQVTLPDGTTFDFSGYSEVRINSVGVNEALTFTLSIALNSDIVITHPTYT